MQERSLKLAQTTPSTNQLIPKEKLEVPALVHDTIDLKATLQISKVQYKYRKFEVHHFFWKCHSQLLLPQSMIIGKVSRLLQTLILIAVFQATSAV